MTTLTPGQPVTVRIAGHDIEAEIRWSDEVNETVGVGFDARTFTVPADWVEPVTPPCPWTEVGTPITWDQNEQRWFGLLTNLGWFRYGVHGMAMAPVDWATDIAPHNPRRLIPQDRVEAAIADVEQKVDAAQAVLNRIQPLREHLPALEAVLRGVSVEDALAKHTPRPALMTRSGVQWWRVHDELYASTAVLATRKQIEATHGPVTEVDDPAAVA